nr:zinc-binding alcohol dehydrogenase family protein [uncultured Caproiciproducens sp.]
MKALMLKEKELLEMVETEKPSCGDGQALIKVSAVSVCGSDIHAYKGENALLKFPRIMGHEVCGIIEEVKANTDGFEVGDKVILVPYLNCGKCIACRKGKTNCCSSLSVYGVHIDGAMAEYVAAPLTHIIKIAGDMDPRAAAVIEPFAISTHAVKRTGVKAGDIMLIAGAGPIGLGAAEIAKTFGAKVMLADVDAKRRAFVKENFDYDYILNPLDSDYREQLEKATNGDYPDIILDSTGNSRSMENNVGYLSNGGRLVYVGICKGDLRISDVEFHKRETELLGSRGATKADFQYVIDCINAKKIDTRKFITHEAPFLQCKEAFDSWVVKGGEVFKAVINME